MNELVDLLKDLKAHIFRANWNKNIFDFVRKNLSTGYLVQIFDFAQNFRNIYQDEVQSAYWQGLQTAIHTVINYFLCPESECSEVVSLVLVRITADLQHDSFVARAAHEQSFKYLAEKGIPMDVLLQFCDNCTAQYKSQRPFTELAQSPLNIIRVFFGEKHGKSQCDGLFGRLNAWMTFRIKSRHTIVTDAHDFYRYCKTDYETPEMTKGKCQHYRVVFQFLTPSDIRRYQDCTLDEAVTGMRINLQCQKYERTFEDQNS